MRCTSLFTAFGSDCDEQAVNMQEPAPSAGQLREALQAQARSRSGGWCPPGVAADEAENPVLEGRILGHGYGRSVIPMVDLPLPPGRRHGRQRRPQDVDFVRVHRRVLTGGFGEVPPVLSEIEAEGVIYVLGHVGWCCRVLERSLYGIAEATEPAQRVVNNRISMGI